MKRTRHYLSPCLVLSLLLGLPIMPLWAAGTAPLVPRALAANPPGPASMPPTIGSPLANGGGALANSGAANAAGNGAGGAGNPGTYGGSGGNPAGQGKGAVADTPAGPTDLGVDISGAGVSPTTQFAYFNKLPESQQSSLRMRCVSVEATPVSAVDARQRSFCDTILANR